MKSPSIAGRHRTTLAVARELVVHQMHLLGRPGVAPRQVAPVMLWGPPGVGKSEMLRTLCEERGWSFIDVRLAQRDPVDLRGLPVPEGDVVRWLPSSDWPRADQPRGILLFDELTAADRTLQVAAYELILDRRLGDTYTLPPGWLVCGAGNRSEDASVSLPMSAALANRFLHVELEADLPAWLAWANANGIRSEVVAFLRTRPGLLLDLEQGDAQRGWPSPRSWARVSHFLEAARSGDSPLSASALHTGLIGLVGVGAAIEFEAFLRTCFDLPDLVDLLTGATRLRALPSTPDALHALVTGLARTVWQVPDRERALDVALRIAAELSPDFAALFFADASALASPDGLKALLAHPALEAMRERHGHLFADAPGSPRSPRVVPEGPASRTASAEAKAASPPLPNWQGRRGKRANGAATRSP